jgi:hypothetical protein
MLSHWQRHVSLIDYIRSTGHNADRLGPYEKLVQAIEREWKRRGKLLYGSVGYFDWPTTEARNGHGKLDDVNWVPEGVLRYLGYQVGKGSLVRTQQRQAVLRRIFYAQLPPFEKPSYLDEWGNPASAARLRKMAESIASFARLAKGQASVDKSVSIAEWERDLSMLHDEFYIGKFAFVWPSALRLGKQMSET